MHRNLSSFDKLSESILKWSFKISLNLDQFDIFSFFSSLSFLTAEPGLDDILLKSNLVLLELNKLFNEFLLGFLSYLLIESLLSLLTMPTKLNTSLMSDPLIFKSSGLAHAIDGDRLTSIRCGLSVSSIKMSYPYTSKQLLRHGT